MDIVALDRFELIGSLGSGADYEVRAATDLDTGMAVVLKRPSPQAVSRQMHGPIEERTTRILEAYEAAGQHCPAVPRVIGVTEAENHDGYFGETLGQEYRVRVEERATGIPLVGDPRSRILRVPIGLGQNLFALHPLVAPPGVADWPIQTQLLEAQEVFAGAGYALLDLGPHNVFYAPGSGKATLIDAGALVGRGVDRTQANRGPQDVHDFYIEMLKFYISPSGPPADATGYFDPYNQRPIITLEQECDELGRAFAGVGGDLAEAATACIDRVRNRDYGNVGEFGRDLQDCLRLITIRNGDMPDRDVALGAWRTALNRLTEDHWTRYQFDADADLTNLSA